MNNKHGWNMGYWAMALLLLLLLQNIWQGASQIETVPYSTFEQALSEGRIAEVVVSERTVTGRLVRTLVDNELRAGSHRTVWDGRDGQGLRVASGVYLVRMQSDSFGATRKLTRLE